MHKKSKNGLAAKPHESHTCDHHHAEVKQSKHLGCQKTQGKLKMIDELSLREEKERMQRAAEAVERQRMGEEDQLANKLRLLNKIRIQ